MGISFGSLEITDKTKNVIMDCLDSNRVSCGKLVKKFEDMFAEKIGTKYAVAVGSGTDALTIALMTLYDFGAKRGDEIIIPALTFIATANAVLEAGFTPVFIDIDPNTLCIDCKKIEEKITDKTKAILPVHLMGNPVDMFEVLILADKYKLFIIEDAAEAYGTSYYGKYAGSIGNMGCFSTYVAHAITTIEGGVIITNDERLAELCRSLRSHGRVCVCSPCLYNTGGGDCKKRFNSGTDIRFEFDRVGVSSKMNEIEAAIGIGGLEKYEEILYEKTRIRNLFVERFKQLGNLIKIYYSNNKDVVIGTHAFPIVFKKQGVRDIVLKALNDNSIDARTLFKCIPTQISGYEFLGYKMGQFPISEYIGDNGLHFGLLSGITTEEVNKIHEIVTNSIGGV